MCVDSQSENDGNSNEVGVGSSLTFEYEKLVRMMAIVSVEPA